jgi:hypothetical protein
VGDLHFLNWVRLVVFHVFKKGRLAIEAQRGVMRAHRSKDDDEWAVMSHGFLRYLKWLKLL